MASSRPGRIAIGSEPARVLYVARDGVGDVAERAIERMGATAIEAVGGTDALKRLAVGAIDAIVVPGTLPDVSTATVVDRATEGAFGVPVVVVGSDEPVPEPGISLAEDTSSAELADRLGQAIDRRRLVEPLGRYDRLERAAIRVARSAVGVDDREAVEAAVREGLRETERYRHVWVGSAGTDRDGRPEGIPSPGGPLGALVEATDRSVVERAIESGEVVADSSAVLDSSGTSERSDSGGRAGLTLVAVPLANGGQLEGVLVLTAGPGDALDGPERELLADLGRIVGAILAARREPGAGGPGRAESAGLVEAVADELRQPLGAAASALEEAQGPGAERASDALETMDDLLDAAVEVAEAGTVDELVETDVHELAVRIWPSIRTRGAELTIGEPAVVEADPTLLERLLAILLEKALDGSDGAGTVKIGALEDARGFAVEIGGTGFAEAVRGAFSGDDSSLGGDGRASRLLFAREIVAAHGWSVSIEANEDGSDRIEVYTDGDGADDSIPGDDEGRNRGDP